MARSGLGRLLDSCEVTRTNVAILKPSEPN
jgi:hypothetical protein